MGILSKKWALLIISAIGNNQKLRYSELEKKLAEISPKTLADRLKELENANLIKREAFAEIPPRVEYSLTKDGIDDLLDKTPAFHAFQAKQTVDPCVACFPDKLGCCLFPGKTELLLTLYESCHPFSLIQFIL